MRDPYYSNALVRCFEMNSSRKETFKYFLSLLKERTKNITENQIIIETVFQCLTQKNDSMDSMLFYVQD